MTEEIQLRGGATTLDPRLDRVVQFDERSREYPIRELLVGDAEAAPMPTSKAWGCRLWNDQGREGACVGFAWSHELVAEPVPISAGPHVATRIYKRAQFLDPWPGEDYSGTSVLAGAKAVQELRSMKKQIMPEYRWAFGVDDLMLSTSKFGPAVIGVNWYEGMFRPDEKGFIRVSGRVMGGHAILVRGIGIKHVAGTAVADRTAATIDRDASYFIMRNSWGKDWGRNGDCFISVNDMSRLLNERGEACIPVLRRAE